MSSTHQYNGRICFIVPSASRSKVEGLLKLGRYFTMSRNVRALKTGQSLKEKEAQRLQGAQGSFRTSGRLEDRWMKEKERKKEAQSPDGMPGNFRTSSSLRRLSRRTPLVLASRRQNC
jgi:hypothetical protein